MGCDQRQAIFAHPVYRMADNFSPEPFNDDGTWRADIWYNTLNTSYVTTALVAARAADPAAKLYINDYNIEGTGTKFCFITLYKF